MPTCSAPRPSFVCAAGIARSSWRRRTAYAQWRPEPRGSWPRQRRRCAAQASRQRSTSTPRGSDYIAPMPEDGQVKTDELDPEAQARRRLALGQIRQYPDPVLRMRAREVEAFDDDLRRLAERMTQLMQDANGVGLAANQAGVIRRVFVFQQDPEEDPIAVVNPVIAEKSQETTVEDEGCLSLQGVQMPVERPLSVHLVGRDLDGGELSLDLDEHAARVVQHELDHLDGVLIIDRTTDEARKAALAVLRPKAVLTP